MLEATETRKAIWEACLEHDDGHCTGCPYRHTCEEQFPYLAEGGHLDVMPSEYVLTDDGKYFYPEP